MNNNELIEKSTHCENHVGNTVFDILRGRESIDYSGAMPEVEIENAVRLAVCCSEWGSDAVLDHVMQREGVPVRRVGVERRFPWFFWLPFASVISPIE
ncbi:hypothetical protein [Paraburkholderia heleia]|uniref:hypothetical protein n=1 Tax=Paraburkholderia heleia TaxID=634127 RepID=UPI002AB71149|nr:hypothetical protein [Paraburkholderia heleia]